MLIVQFNNYQNAAFFTSSNRVAGNLYAAMSDIDSYFGLKSSNEELLQQNRELSNRIEALQERLRHYEDSATVAQIQKAMPRGYYYNIARAVNNSLNKINNYITIDKGSDDGIKAEMGVFNNQGVVGIVYTTSPHFSVVIPLLNSKSNISCRVKGSKSFCALQWDGKDTRYSYLVDLPRYSKFEPGDTVVTSGFSSIFPGDIPVGTIVNTEDSEDGMFYCAKVELFTDFSSIDHLYIVGNNKQEEQKLIERPKKK